MSITITDPNAAFTAERGRQIAASIAAQGDFDARVTAGTLVSLGDGRFRVNEPGSFDNGEILIRRNGLILPEHGLDTTTGRVALYSNTPAWHQLGQIVPEGVSDIEEVLTLGGINFEVCRSLSLFSTDDGKLRTMPDKFALYRDDTMAGLGVVGNRYEIFQNRRIFEFLQDLVGQYDVLWESAGALRGGRSVFVCLRLPENVSIDASGINDQILPIIAAINSHDGTSPAQAVVTPWRIECGNTERLAVNDAYVRWAIRHTRNALDRVKEARQTLHLSTAYFRQFAAEQEALARTNLAIDEFRSVVDDVFEVPEPGSSTRKIKNSTKRSEQLVQLFDANAQQLGRTAYAAERAFTEWADWKKDIRPSGVLKGKFAAARATAALEGAHDDTKTKAHRRLMTLVRA